MSNKKSSRKGIESLRERIKEHQDKLRKAKEDENIGLESYYEKEIANLEKTKKKLEKRVVPKLKRKKL